MITAQDIRERTFKKSKIGGYDMEEIDEFLEAIADELTAAQKESAVLKSKMKVLVDKIEEYRGNESALNQAVLSAQKLAVQIENDAKERAAKLISDAEEERQAKLSGIAEQVKAENLKLDAAKAESAKFLDGIKAMYSAHLKKISAITDDDSFAELEKTIAPAKKEVKEDVAKATQKVEEDVVKVAQKVEEDVKVSPVANAVRAEASKVEQDIDATFKEIEKNVSKIEPKPAVQMDLSKDLEGIFPPVKDPDSTQPFTL